MTNWFFALTVGPSCFVDAEGSAFSMDFISGPTLDKFMRQSKKPLYLWSQKGFTTPILLCNITRRCPCNPYLTRTFCRACLCLCCSVLHGLSSPVGRIRDIMSELIDYVRALDGLDMVHRDIKPLNLMLSEQGLKVSSRSLLRGISCVC